MYYILTNDLHPIECGVQEWAAWCQKHHDRRSLGRTTIGKALVSTTFLGLDHSYGQGHPILWETMVFDPQEAGDSVYCERYTSREAAAQGHARVVAALLSGKTPEEIGDCDCVCDDD